MNARASRTEEPALLAPEQQQVFDLGVEPTRCLPLEHGGQVLGLFTSSEQLEAARQFMQGPFLGRRVC